ncbi:MAG: Ig-like domain-containing protein [Bacilli bacterium]|nr:Ig-like domain-containing protein [Bacilli bacterium]
MKYFKNLVFNKFFLIGFILLIIIVIIVFNIPKNKDKDDLIATSDIYFNDSVIMLDSDEVYNASVINTTENVKYSIDDEAVASVDSNGIVTGLKEGIATLTATTDSGISKSIEIVVKGIETISEGVGAEVEEDIAVSSIIIKDSEVSLTTGGSYQLTYEVLPSNATDKNLVWESTDSRVATVSLSGLISARQEGTAVLTAYTNNNISASVMVSVNAKEVTVSSIEIFPSNLEMLVGESSILVIKYNPSNTTNKTTYWSSSDNSIVEVIDGNIYARKEGTATITATSLGKSSMSNITVKKSGNDTITLSSIKLNKTNITLNVGDTTVMQYTVLPINASTSDLSWTTSNDKVFTVSNGKVTAKGVGVATLSVVSSNGKGATATITVLENTILADTVYLNYDSDIYLNVGDTKQLRATIIPLDTTNQSLTWISSNSSSVTISSSGLIKAIGYGKSTVAVITSNGKIARLTVNVLPDNPDFKYGEKLNGTTSFCLEGGITSDKQYNITDLNNSLNDYINNAYEIANIIGDLNPKRAEVLAAAYWLGFNPYCLVKYKGGYSVATTVKGWWGGWTSHTGIDCHNFIKWCMYQIFGKTYESEILGKKNKLFKSSGLTVDEIVNVAIPGDTLRQDPDYMGSGHVALVLSVDKEARTVTIIHSQGTGIKIQTLTQFEHTKYTSVTDLSSIYGD